MKEIMCGIFGYKGPANIKDTLLHGLERLEYRGYDSAGIALLDTDHTITSLKSVGRVSQLVEHVSNTIGNDDRNDICGIAHTRRATHGGVTHDNAHPHCSNDGTIYLVHNGIIENYQALKKQLTNQGYTFYSQTDSEVVANLMQEHWTGSLLETAETIFPMLEGAFAISAISTATPNEIIGLRYGSPLVFGYSDGAFYLSSDPNALNGLATNKVFLDEGDIVHIHDYDYSIRSSGEIVTRAIHKTNTSQMANDDSGKGDYDHYMLKEIAEQGDVLRNGWRGRIDFDHQRLHANAFDEIDAKQIERVVFVGCGTSSFAGQIGAMWIENLAGIPATFEIASEFLYKKAFINPQTLYVFVSQSGETRDTIQCLDKIRAKGGTTCGIVNVVGSTIARDTDFGFYIRAGVEVSVASTKAFTGMINVILLLALHLGQKNNLSYAKYEEIVTHLEQLPSQIESIVADTAHIQAVAKTFARYAHCFFLGKQYQFAIANEGSLKLKELSYINAQSYASGELKHGSLALVDEQFPSVLLMPQDDMFVKNTSTLAEIKARSGPVLTISDVQIDESDRHITIPSTITELYPFLTNIACQLLAYYTARELDRDIDKPRNLAKSVTVS